MDRLSTHIQDRLTSYIKQEMEHGYSLEAIKRVLTNYHHHNIIDEAIKELKKENFAVKHRRKPGKKLAKGAFYEVVTLLQDYIVKQKARGYTTKQIREAMINYGHSQDAVLAAIDAVEYGKEPLYVEPFAYDKVQKVLLPLGLLSFFIFTFWLSGSVQEDPIRLMVLFSPIPLTMILLKGLESTAKNKQSLLAVPIVLVILGYVAMLSDSGFFSGVQGELISGLNFMIAFFYTMLAIGVTPEVEQTMKEEEKMLQEEETIIEEHVRDHKPPLKVHVGPLPSAEDVEKQIEEDIKTGKHGLKPVMLVHKKRGPKSEVDPQEAERQLRFD